MLMHESVTCCPTACRVAKLTLCHKSNDRPPMIYYASTTACHHNDSLPLPPSARPSLHSSANTSAVPTNILRLAHGMKWICRLMNLSRNSGNNLPQKYVSFKRRTQNYRKRRPTITFILPRVNAFSANGTTAGFIPTTGASTVISRLPIIRLIHFRQKLVGLILTMRFQ